MPLQILKIEKESFPAATFIGKKYTGRANWGEWWENDWFSVLEKSPRLEENGDAYIGAVRIVNGMSQRWIGMFFPQGTTAPEGFDAVDMEPTDYAVCFLRDKEGSAGFYTPETHALCLEALTANGLQRKEDDWCFERYNCPRFTSPDENGDVILDYGIAVKE